MKKQTVLQHGIDILLFETYSIIEIVFLYSLKFRVEKTVVYS